MMQLESTIQKVIRDIPECVAAGYVDMATGMLLAVRTIDSHPREVLDLVAAATADLFQGSTVTAIETVSYTHLRAHETVLDLVCRLLLENKKK